MTTIRDAVTEMLVNNGLWQAEAEQIMQVVIASDGEMQSLRGSWCDDKLDYPPALLGLLWVGVRATADKWLAENKPTRFHQKSEELDMSKETVVINGTTYVPKPEPTDLQIVIVDSRGLTFVGHYAAAKTDTGLHVIRDARCVIRWGTAHHLSELAAKGPLSDTVLSQVPRDVRVSNVILVYDCDREAWDGK